MTSGSNEILNLLRSKKVIIYGTGNICNHVLSSLRNKGINPETIIDAPEKRGQRFLEYTITGIDSLKSLDTSAIVIICSDNVEEVFDSLYGMDHIDLILTYDLILSLDSNKISYSQCGEDMIIAFFFNTIGKNRIKYLDLGANDPVHLSNTFYFYENGSEGVLVEPNTTLTDKAGILRSRDTVINAGVGPEGGSLKYYILDANTLNTCSKEDADKCISLGHKLIDTKDIPIIGINQLLSDYGRPDFLSLDVEGIDFDILKALDFDRFAPTCICIETAEYYGGKRPDFDELNQFMSQKGYMIYGDTFINTIYVKTDILSKFLNL